ncbi:redoxin domain-containing protein [Brevundimonas sp.]|uniref:redoxin domain-containing protein n=1 Tax=Brevundimonas sp. TaxID=1871086 RepID=UPI003BA87574
MGGSKTAIIVVAAIVLVGAIGGGAAWLYANPGSPAKASEPVATKSALARFAVGPLARLETPADTPVAPDYVFKSRDGADVRFADFRGKVVVVNLWAMWCAPCRTEMPTLATLSEAYKDSDMVVLPINVDNTPDALADATSFIDVHEPLPLYNDPKFQLPFEFPGKGKMPQTILLDRQGRIRATFAGEADWAGAEARALVDALLAEPA